MASIVTDLANDIIPSVVSLGPNNVAVIHCKVEKTTGVFSKITVHFSLDAKWQATYNGRQISLNKVMVQTGYKNDSGEVDYKISGLVANNANQSLMMPMIWTRDNSGYIYQATYVSSQSLVLLLNYTVAFELTDDLPPELQAAFKGSQELGINTRLPATDYSVTISID